MSKAKASAKGERGKWDVAWKASAGKRDGFRSLTQKRFVWPFEGFIVSTARLVRAGAISLEKTRVLDFGCGHGRHAMFFVKSGFRHVSGVDLSAEAVSVARAWAASEDAPIDYRAYDGKRLPWAKGSFDLATCFSTFHHIPAEQQRAVARELTRVIKKGGKLLWAEHGSRTTRVQPGRRIGPRSIVIEDPGDPEDGIVQHLYTLSEYRALFPDFDFEVGAVENLEGEGLSLCTSIWNLVGTKVR